MSNVNDGGPAFARAYFEHATTGEWSPAQDGMTLRDWFAGQALAGLCANANDEIVSSRLSMPAEDVRQGVSVACYAMADAMLKAREAHNG